MLLQGVSEVDTQEELRHYVLTNGCYSEIENLRIFEKWFAQAPRYLFRAVDNKYKIHQKILCDVGCSYGMNLIYCVPESYGIEMEDYYVKFARSLGLVVYKRDVLNDDLSDLPKVEVVWCSAVLEHVDAPHIFLRNLHILLKPEGLVVIYVPTIPLISSLRYIPGLKRYISGHTASDHINAFVPSTLQFFCERAGFKTIEISPFYPGILGLFNHIPVANRFVGGCVYIGQKTNGWEYPEKATRRVALNSTGFVVRKQEFPR